MLNAETLAADTRLPPCLAVVSTRVCSGGMTAAPMRPNRKNPTIAAGWLCTAASSSAEMTARAASAPCSVGRRARSASRPASGVPITMPTPTSARTTGTVAAAKPVTSVSSGAM